MGEELVVDGAEEIIKIEKEIFSTSMEGEADVREIKD
jgi:hypothetical protein